MRISDTGRHRRGRRLFRAARAEHGTSLLETALVMPLLLLLTFALVDFATMFYAYLALENGVSQATRYGVTGNQIEGLSRESSIMTAMREATPTLTIEDDAFSFSHLVPGGTVWQGGAGEPNDIEKVSVNYTWDLLTPVLRPFFTDGQVTLVVESAMKNEPRFE